MKVISFKNTTLFKRGLWLSAAALIACVAAPSVASGALWQNPVVNMVPLFILAGFWAYFLHNLHVHRLADGLTERANEANTLNGG